MKNRNIKILLKTTLYCVMKFGDSAKNYAPASVDKDLKGKVWNKNV